MSARDEDAASRGRACQCGMPDLPGMCPGPANCAMVDNRPKCKTCGEPVREREAVQHADDSWTCPDCLYAEELLREAAPDLLAALRCFASLADETPPPGILRIAWTTALAAARAAVAKAGG